MLYLVSSDTDLDQTQLTTIYQRRWKVEEYHKSRKQNASMGKSSTKTLTTQANHFVAAVLAYTKLEVLKLTCGMGHFRLKAQRHTAGLKAAAFKHLEERVSIINTASVNGFKGNEQHD